MLNRQWQDDERKMEEFHSEHSVCDVCHDKMDQLLIVNGCEHQLCRRCLNKHVRSLMVDASARCFFLPFCGCSHAFELMDMNQPMVLCFHPTLQHRCCHMPCRTSWWIRRSSCMRPSVRPMAFESYLPFDMHLHFCVVRCVFVVVVSNLSFLLLLRLFSCTHRCCLLQLHSPLCLFLQGKCGIQITDSQLKKGLSMLRHSFFFLRSFLYLIPKYATYSSPHPKCAMVASFLSDLTGASVYDSIHKVLMNKLVETNMAFSRCPKCDVIIEQIIDPMTLSGDEDDDIDEGSSTFDGEVCSPSSIPSHAVKHRDE
jgi:hypothetical protein